MLSPLPFSDKPEVILQRQKGFRPLHLSIIPSLFLHFSFSTILLI
ncbi:hypothetical protein CIT292_06342 [Citrobacter youngae ATCC 29220]|uniref:Uncharacterized protein n=1 Tax=Citrobacter youngae ATCC 29220 TaxID=500640 RepID=D4B7T8_9ENTR|nr:hypothetical protein CIT292_06342 [Citrobacter youngae ATCC 29220]